MRDAMRPADPHDLQRFVDAQDDVFEAVRGELREGRKTSHSMWFVFPQLRGLGHSPMATRFGIASLAEARAYLAHPVLGPRLLACTGLVLRVDDRAVGDIFGHPDDAKFRSCMTLFQRAAPQEPLLAQALRKYFDAAPDARTLELLRLQGN
jgi:uncharacterized protein (DUF1810 family)